MEEDGDFRAPARHAFARAQVERNASPAPVVDVELACDESFGLGIGGHIRFIAICAHSLIHDGSGAVLPAYHIPERLDLGHRTDCLYYLGFFRAHGIGFFF